MLFVVFIIIIIITNIIIIITIIIIIWARQRRLFCLVFEFSYAIFSLANPRFHILSRF